MREAALWHQLLRPAGPPGSGRSRYAAAMALYDFGHLDWQQLEAYREGASLDAQDPRQMLADRGLALPLAPAAPSTLGLHLLLEEADRCLSAQSGAGIAEIRAGLAPCFTTAPRSDPSAISPFGSAKRLVEALLPAALALLRPDHAALAEAIALAAPLLRWISYDAYGDSIGPDFPQSHAFASLVGTEAPWYAEDFDFGLFLMAPHLLYRDHVHAAPELYLPLTGPHSWRFAPGSRFHDKPAFAPVWNPSHRPHATLTGAVPFLALFGWTRDVDAPARVLPAQDWGLYEGMR